MQQKQGYEACDPSSVAMIHRHLTGDLTEAEFEELERGMLASPELRQAYLRAIRIEAALRDHALHESEPPVSTTGTWWRTTAIAATIALCGLALWKFNPWGPAGETAAPTRPVEIATLGDARDCVWAGSAQFTMNKRLSAGLLELDSGVALIEFDEGARLALQGPAALELIGPKTARLHHGSASVRCEDGLYSFSLLTPTSIVTDLGTEFGVAVAKDGTSELHVLDGEIEVTGGLNEERQHNRFMTVGKTLLVSANGTNQELPKTTHRWIRDHTTQSDREAKGLDPLLTYDFHQIGSGNFNTNFTIGGSTKPVAGTFSQADLSLWTEGTQYTVFTGIAPDAGGNISISVVASSGTDGALAAMQISTSTTPVGGFFYADAVTSTGGVFDSP